MSEKMREEFEREWGQMDSAQGVYFIPELNTYGSELYAQHEYAEMKSSAWFYFQKGWQASRQALVVELPDVHPEQNTYCDWYRGYSRARSEGKSAIEAAGLRYKP